MKTQTLILETKFVLLAFLSTFRFILANNYIQRHSIYKFNMVNEDVVAMSNSDSNVLTTFISKNTTTTLIIISHYFIVNSKKEITLGTSVFSMKSSPLNLVQLPTGKLFL